MVARHSRTSQRSEVVGEGTLLAEHLHCALDNRIRVEVNGIISYPLSITMEVFAILTTHARNNDLTIRAVATGIRDGANSVESVLALLRPASSPQANTYWSSSLSSGVL